jgi:eukaryotic-like serine/threonine-protein kinase
MSTEKTVAFDRDQRLEQAIAAYRQAVQEGAAPEQQEWLDRYPDLVAELAEFFADRPRLERPTEAAQGPAPPVEVQGRCFGDYVLLEEIARGGMGAVYKARQVSLNRIVALKLILAGPLASVADVQRFRAEAEAAAHLDHPNIVPIYEVGEHQGQHFFSMKLIEGGSLEQAIGARQSPVGSKQQQKWAARLVVQVARAVHHAHQRGLLHRDLKPSNILLDAQGQPLITDFGLAKRVEGNSTVTQPGVIVGTPSYMAPEQALGQKGLTTAVDVYALGAVLYELLTGRPPFQAGTPLDTLLQVVEREPARPCTLNPAADRDLETICLKCLDKERTRRYGSAEALADDLERWLAGEPILARRSSAWERLVKWARRRPAVAGLLAAVASLLVVVAIGATIAAVWFQRVAHEAAQAQQAAEQAEQQKETERLRAEDLAEANRLSLYAARINVAQQVWERGDVGGAVALLESLRPGPSSLPLSPEGRGGGVRGRKDLRGFEWYYLWRLCHSERLALEKQSKPVRCVAFSPDSQVVAAAGADGTVRLWEATTGRQRQILNGHTDWVSCVTFSPDGKTLASASADRTVKLWDVATGTQRRTLEGHRDVVGCLAFAPDGKTLASANGYWTIRVGNPLYQFLRPPSSGLLGYVKLWDVAKGAELATLEGNPNEILTLAFSPDGRTLAAGESKDLIRLWDVNGRRERATLAGHRGPVFSLAFSPDGKTLASGSWDKTVRLWDVAGKKERATFHGHREPVFSLAFSPDGKTLATGGFDQTVRMWDTTTGRERFRINGHTAAVVSLAFAPDGQSLATAGWDGSVKLWDATRPQACDHPSGRVARGGYSVAFSPDGKLLAMARPPLVSIWETAGGRAATVLPGLREGDISVAFSPDGKTLATGGSGGVARLWDVATWQMRFELRGHTNKIWSLAFAPDGRRLATGSRDGTVKLWDTGTGQLRGDYKTHRGRSVRFVAFAPDGKTLAVDIGSGVELWDPATGNMRAFLQGHKAGIDWGVFAPDGRVFATGSWDRSVKLWDPATGQELATLQGHTNMIYHGTFTPDGSRLATASWDGTVKLWHVATRQELLTLRASTGVLWCVAFSPDGRTLATGSGWSGTDEVALWRAATDAEAARAGKE